MSTILLLIDNLTIIIYYALIDIDYQYLCGLTIEKSIAAK